MLPVHVVALQSGFAETNTCKQLARYLRRVGNGGRKFLHGEAAQGIVDAWSRGHISFRMGHVGELAVGGIGKGSEGFPRRLAGRAGSDIRGVDNLVRQRRAPPETLPMAMVNIGCMVHQQHQALLAAANTDGKFPAVEQGAGKSTFRAPPAQEEAYASLAFAAFVLAYGLYADLQAWRSHGEPLCEEIPQCSVRHIDGGRSVLSNQALRVLQQQQVRGLAHDRA